MRTFLILLLVATWSAAMGQAPYIQWQKALGGTALDNGVAIVQLPDSGYMMAGTTGSNDGDVSGSHGPYDVWVVRLSASGAIVWQKCLGGTFSDYGQSICATRDGNYVVAGSTFSSDGDVTANHGAYDDWVVKLTPGGTVLWQHTYGGSSSEFGHSIRETADSGFIVVGSSNSHDGDVTGNHGDYDVWVVRLSPTGALLWQKSLGGTMDDEGGMGLQTPDGGFIIAGNTASSDGDVTGNHGGEDLWVVKLNATGGMVWQKTLGGTGDEAMTDEFGPGSVGVTTDGGYFVAGWSNSTDGDVTGNHGDFDFWVVKLNDTGHIQWQHSYGGTTDDEATCFEQTADGGYIVGGTTLSNDGDVTGNHGDHDYWLIKISDTGALQWQKCLGGTGFSPNDCVNAVHQAYGGGYIVTGFSSSADGDVTGAHGGLDAWVVKLNCTMPHAGALTGPDKVCVAATVTLADTAAGGMWLAGNNHATVTGGVVTGVSAGVDTIVYTVANTCGSVFTTKTVTVEPLPAPVLMASGLLLSTTVGFVSYQWNRNGSAVGGATNASYTATANGYYTVTVTDGNGCIGTSAADTISHVGVGERVVGNEFSVQPNPARDVVYVSGGDFGSIELQDMMGRLVKRCEGCKTISMADLPEGPYIIRLRDERQALVYTGKLMKQ